MAGRWLPALVLLASAACSSGGGTSTGTAIGPTTAAPTTASTAATGVTTPASAATTADPTATATDATTTTHAAGPDTDAERVDAFSRIGPLVQEFVDANGLNGAGLVVVEVDDGIVHEDYWGEFGPDRISFVASSSKMIAAGVLARLDDDGLLDLDAPVADVVDWGAAHPDVTPAQLLSNSSGLPGLLSPVATWAHRCAFLPDGTLQQCAEQIFTTPTDDAATVAPDTEFRYGGGQWQVAGAVAEAASGRSWAELIDEIYVEPCGLETLAFDNHWSQFEPGGFVYPEEFDGDVSLLRPTDNPNIEAGAYATPRDYAQLLLMHLRDGHCDDNRVLSAAAVDRMHSDRIAEVYGGTAPGGRGYGLGWWIDRESGRIDDNGAFGTVPWLDVDQGFGAYLVIEADVFTGMELAASLYDLVEDAVLATR